MGKRCEKIFLGAACAAGLSFSCCTDSERNYSVRFVERSAILSPDAELNPLRLIIEINEGGRLTLNKIEAGTLGDTTFLCEKLKTIFADREKAAISAREVIILSQSQVENEELEELIAGLKTLDAAPILVINDYR